MEQEKKKKEEEEEKDKNDNILIVYVKVLKTYHLDMFGSRNHVTWYNQEQIQRMSAYPMGGSLCRRTPKLVPSWAPSTEAPWDDCC